MHDTYQKIQEDLRQLKADVAAAAGQAGTEAGAYAAAAGERARHTLAELEQRAREQKMRTDAYAHEHPWHVAAAAGVIGAVLGLLFSARGRRR